jgi:hypothetical protein
MTRHALSLLFVLLASGLRAQASDTAASASMQPSSRYALKQAGAEQTPQQSGRYSLHARFTPAGADDLRESTRYSLISHFNSLASPTASVCVRIFANGFEVP